MQKKTQLSPIIVDEEEGIVTSLYSVGDGSSIINSV